MAGDVALKLPSVLGKSLLASSGGIGGAASNETGDNAATKTNKPNVISWMNRMKRCSARF
jgi:hypothetical protein